MSVIYLKQLMKGRINIRLAFPRIHQSAQNFNSFNLPFITFALHQLLCKTFLQSSFLQFSTVTSNVTLVQKLFEQLLNLSKE